MLQIAFAPLVPAALTLLSIQTRNETGMSRPTISVDLGENYYDPMQFVESIQLAEELGLEIAWIGDHLFPWAHSGKKSAFAWSVIPVALERTRNIKVGPDVTCPIGGRYHPLLVAQAAATIDNMYPSRFILAVGSGEAVNEARFFPQGFPKWRERIERLAEAVVLMKKLWQSEEYFKFEGRYFNVGEVFLYTKPKGDIPIYFSAIGTKAASYAGAYGDHLITINSADKCREIVQIFETAAREKGKDPSKMDKMAFLDITYADEKRGIEDVRRIGEAAYLVEGANDQQDPRRIEEMSTELSDREILEKKYFCAAPDDIIEIVERYSKVGITHVAIYTRGNPAEVRLIGEKVLPYFEQK